MIGKLPPEDLEKFVLQYNGASSKNVISGPSIGEDSAVIKFDSDKYLLASSDPIVGADNSDVGKFLIDINVNDISAKGGTPKYLILTLIAPSKLGKKYIKEVMKDIDKYAKKYNIAIIGGHTEISNKYNAPVITATILGESDKIYNVNNIKFKDPVYLIGNVALEGIYLLYKKHEKKLKNLLTESEKKDVLSYITKLSIYKYSKIAKNYSHFMHDPTEGGLIGGLSEISSLMKDKGIILNKKIKLLNPVRKISDFFNIDPHHLISSGSLLTIINKNKEKYFLSEISKTKFPYQKIGYIGKENSFTISHKEELWDNL
ncbi:MAG TPA: AIR synthase related protein [Candidatus Mcinerneyibacterium sp.]|nr:AIR synthase related protein [Candidatus Mcinerneyibacterium sp.]